MKRTLIPKRRTWLALVCSMIVLGGYAQSEVIKPAEGARGRTNFNREWKFRLGDADGAEKTGFNDAGWRTVNLPHDWSIEGEFNEQEPSGGPGGYLPTGIGWYRKRFVLPETSNRLWIEFGGVYMNSEVWVNEHCAGKNAYGYTSFYCDITPYIRSGENVIAVRVDNSIQRNSRWYSGSGIYRNVWLHSAGPVHIPQWGTYVTTPVVNDTLAIVALRVAIENTTRAPARAVLSSQVLDADGKVVATAESEVTILAGKGHDDYRQELAVGMPRLWSVESPTLYTLRTEIRINGQTADRVDTRFGIRTLEFSAEKGFLLNGKQVKINGVNLHDDAGCLGAAVPVAVWERRLKLLKEMGANGIRTAHNPRSEEFMNLCDEMGFLVMNEFTDEWMVSKEQTTAGYSLYFRENWRKDVTNFIRRDRNHPSVVIWSAGNEVRDQMYTEGIGIVRDLVALFHAEDPTRPVTQGNDQIIAEPLPAHREFLEALDIVGYNYAGRWRERAELFYTPDKILHPHRKMIGTENGAVRSTRDFSLGNDKNTVRPNYMFGMLSAEALWKYTATHDFVMGDFMWTGIDYLGEARWPGRGSGGSPLDMAGFPRPGYYFYQSQWTDKPMIYIFPHWNWEGREGQVIPVFAYSNCDAVELFVNGKSFGEQRLEFPSYGMAGKYPLRDRPDVQETTDNLHLMWTVPYQPGEIKAVGKIQGQTVYTETVRTTGKPAALRVTADKSTLRADGDDVAHIRVEITDSKGNPVPCANNEIRFLVKGEGQLLGLESGDNRSHNTGHFRHRDPSVPAAKEAAGGLILGYVQAGRKAGHITVEISSPGLKGAAVNLVSR